MTSVGQTAMFFFFLWVIPAYARWGTVDDASSLVDSVLEANIHADGSYEYVLDEMTEITKDSARGSKGIMRINYNSRAGTLEVLEAETINGNQTIPVDRKTIEDKPLASRGEGFDQINQIMVAFPEAEVGSKVHLKYRRVFKEVPIPGFFSLSFFPSGDYERKAHVKITSALPLFVKKNDPAHQMKIETFTEKGKHVFVMDQKKPIFWVPLDEDDPLLSFRSLPWIQISSTESWSDMARPMLNRFEKIVNAPLPGIFERILNQAKKAGSDIERINTVTSELATAIHYMGDWRPVNGGYVPRSIDEIARTRFGDCKDFSASTISILRRLGMEAYMAWVYRGAIPEQEPYAVPLDSHFNHAIVWAKSGNRVFWIDPTNIGSFAQGIFEDIIDRPALVFDVGKPALQRIPGADVGSSTMNSHLDLRLGAEEIHVQGGLFMSGRAASPWAGAGLSTSTETLQHGLIKYFSGGDRIRKWKFKDFDFKSRIVKDVSLQFEYEELASGFKTSAGPGWYLNPPGVLWHFFVNPEKRVSDIFLGQPFEARREIHLESLEKVGDKSLDCDVDSEWMHAIRKVTQAQDGLKIVDSTELKKPVLTGLEMKTRKFEKFQSELRKCFSGVAVIYKSLK